jgi:16S rRNA G966 N2-methylase RsmD
MRRDSLQELHGSFDFVLIDPPFITREVWEKYAITARLWAEAAVRNWLTELGISDDVDRILE